MKGKSLFLFVPLLAFYSCHSNKTGSSVGIFDMNADSIEESATKMILDKQSPTRVVVRQSEENERINLSELADSIDYVCLETVDKENLLGKVEKIQVADSLIYVLDRTKNPGVYVFSIHGTYLNRIGTIGQGIGEYAEPTDFSISGDTVYVYDQFQHRLIAFDGKGKHLFDKHVPFYSIGFHVFDANSYLFYVLDADNRHLGALNDYTVLSTDSTCRIHQYGFYQKQGKYSSIWLQDNFQETGNSVYYHFPFSGEINTIDYNGVAQYKYQLDFGRKTLPNEYLLRENWKRFTDEDTQRKYLLFPGNFRELESWLYFSYLDNHITHHGFYHKSDGRVILAKGIVNDLFKALPFGTVIGGNEHTLISVAWPNHLLQAARQSSKEDLEKSIGSNGMDFISSLSEEDNPILIFMHLKP